jgi:hypothetical protein
MRILLAEDDLTSRYRKKPMNCDDASSEVGRRA